MVQLSRDSRSKNIAPRLAVALFFLLLAAALVVFYWPYLTESASFYVFDFTYGWHANMEYVAQQWRHGKIVLWNPYLMCGVSQLALTSPSIFYPPDWLLAFLSFNRGMACLFVFNHLMAALGAFLLIAACGLGTLPALFGAAAYAVSGYFFSTQVAYSYQATSTWIPWCAWALLEIDRRARGVVIPPGAWRKRACLFTALAAIFAACSPLWRRYSWP